MLGGDGQIYAAVAALSGEVNNISVMENEVYIYPDGGLSDYYAYRFLSGELSFNNGEIPGDYSLLLSFGPYSFHEGDESEIAFAILGGLSRDDIFCAFSRARDKYVEVGVDKTFDVRGAKFDVLCVYPNPFTGRLHIYSDLLPRAPLKIYDVAGRLVCTLGVEQSSDHHSHAVWNSDGIAPGIYFIHTPRGSRKVVKLR